VTADKKLSYIWTWQFQKHLAYPSPTSAGNNARWSAAQTINIKLISSSALHPRSE